MTEEDGSSGRPEAQYENLKPIGKGKFAIVYRATRKSDGADVALKKITVGEMDAQQREKCLKEVRLLQSLDHPNIIEYMDSFIVDSDLIIVVEWAAAGDLKRQLRKAVDKEVHLEERVVWKYFSQIAEAIEHMHSRRIMHRDLKPANIFLTLSGQVKVGDLGLGRAMSEHTMEAHSKVGTPLYMSPEVLRGGGYDWKSDIWSLGCLLYELAMLKSPFKSEGLNLYSLFQKISRGDYLPLPDRYSNELRSLVDAMIQTDPSERPDIEQIVEYSNRMRALTAQRRQAEADPAAFPAGVPIGPSGAAASGMERKAQLASRGQNARDWVPTRPDGAAANGIHLHQQAKAELEAGDEEDEHPETTTPAGTPSPAFRPQTRLGRRSQANDDASEQAQQFKGSNAEGKVHPALDGYFSAKAAARQAEQPGEAGEKSDDGDDMASRGKGGRENDAYHANASWTADAATVERPQRRDISVRRAPKLPAKKSVERAPSQPPSYGRPQIVVDSHADLSQAGPAIAEMERLRDFLAVLGYHEEQRERGAAGSALLPLPVLSPAHFALPAPQDQASGIRDRSQRFTRRNQYVDFVSVALWLAQKLPDFGTVPALTLEGLETNAPHSVVKLLLVRISMSLPDSTAQQYLAGVNPNALACGFGVAVCGFLRHLAEMVLLSKGAPNPSLRYSVEAKDEEVGATQGTPAEDEVEDEVDVIEEDADEEVENVGSLSARDAGACESSVEILEARIDPIQWRQEVERVGPRLRQLQGSRASRNSVQAWSARLATAKESHTRIHGMQGPATSTGVRRAGRASATEPFRDALLRLRRGVEEACGQIEGGERLVNRQYDNVCSQYAELSLQHLAATTQIRELEESISEKTVEASRLQEDLEQVLAEVKTKGANASDASPLIQIREALRSLKTEMQDMDRNLAIVNAEVVRRQKRAVARSFQATNVPSTEMHLATSVEDFSLSYDG